jgi:predicted metal-dependent phosphoesterase TrpH
MRKIISLLVLLVIIFHIDAQQRKEINMPNIQGYLTLKCDFHMHTIFSDGEVWPGIRVEEAWRDGLDAIAITDHLNYKWSFLKEYINSEDGNAPYNTAKLTADRMGITLIKACEINRGMPPGHFNVLFAKDINQLKDSNFFIALSKAKAQGAFIQWNHPGYSQKIHIQWFEVHDRLFKQGLMQGIEVYNQKVFFPEAVQWANDKKLTITCSSDIHELIDKIVDEKSHRPITLVFAKENSVESMREAMFAGRTAAWFGNQLVGHSEHLIQLFNASVSVIDLPMIIENRAKYIEFKNSSDVDYELELFQKVSGVGMPHKIKLNANRVTLITITPDSTVTQAKSFNAKYKVENLKSISGEDIVIEFTFNKIGSVENHAYKKEKYPEVK